METLKKMIITHCKECAERHSIYIARMYKSILEVMETDGLEGAFWNWVFDFNHSDARLEQLMSIYSKNQHKA